MPNYDTSKKYFRVRLYVCMYAKEIRNMQDETFPGVMNAMWQQLASVYASSVGTYSESEDMFAFQDIVL